MSWWDDISGWASSLLGGGTSNSDAIASALSTPDTAANLGSAAADAGSSWWQGPIGVAGINGLVGAAQGAFTSRAGADKDNKAFQNNLQLEQMREASQMAQLQAKLAADAAMAGGSSGATMRAAELAARAKKFGDIVNAYSEQANGLRASGRDQAGAFGNLAGIMQAPSLRRG